MQSYRLRASKLTHCIHCLRYALHFSLVSHFLKTDPLSSTKLFETSKVNNTLLFELTATLSATDWISRMSV